MNTYKIFVMVCFDDRKGQRSDVDRSIPRDYPERPQSATPGHRSRSPSQSLERPLCVELDNSVLSIARSQSSESQESEISEAKIINDSLLSYDLHSVEQEILSGFVNVYIISYYYHYNIIYHIIFIRT